MIEKERKFLLTAGWSEQKRSLSKVAKSKVQIEQIYLTVGEGETMLADGQMVPIGSKRIRKSTNLATGASVFTATTKSKKFNGGQECHEDEHRIDRKQYEQAKESADPAKNIINKERWEVVIPERGSNFTVEIDIYSGGALAGLVVAEVEAENCEEFIPATGWIEITEDLRFGNNQLAAMTYEEVTALVGEKLNKRRV